MYRFFIIYIHIEMPPVSLCSFVVKFVLLQLFSFILAIEDENWINHLFWDKNMSTEGG